MRKLKIFNFLQIAICFVLCSKITFQKSIHLSKIQALTLRRSKLTKSRRKDPIPQLNCEGDVYYVPDVVQCRNVGFDGESYQWDCYSDLPSNLKFDKISISCEGYSYSGDDNVLVGSCGLFYSLIDTNSASQTRKERRNQKKWKKKAPKIVPPIPPKISKPIGHVEMEMEMNAPTQNKSSFGSVFIIVIIVFIMSIFLYFFTTSNNTNNVIKSKEKSKNKDKKEKFSNINQKKSSNKKGTVDGNDKNESVESQKDNDDDDDDDDVQGMRSGVSYQRNISCNKKGSILICLIEDSETMKMNNDNEAVSMELKDFTYKGLKEVVKKWKDEKIISMYKLNGKKISNDDDVVLLKNDEILKVKFEESLVY